MAQCLDPLFLRCVLAKQQVDSSNFVAHTRATEMFKAVNASFKLFKKVRCPPKLLSALLFDTLRYF